MPKAKQGRVVRRWGFYLNGRLAYAGVAEAAPVSLQIFDANGRQVRSLVDSQLDAGSHSISWNTESADGNRVASGIYYAKLNVAGSVAMQPLTVLR